MRVAGTGVEVLELAERGAPAGAGAERGADLGERGDGLVAEQVDDRVGGELGWSHYGTIAVSHSRNDAITRTGCTPQNPGNLLHWWEPVADHESCGAGVLNCETTGTSRKLFFRGPLPWSVPFAIAVTPVPLAPSTAVSAAPSRDCVPARPAGPPGSLAPLLSGLRPLFPPALVSGLGLDAVLAGAASLPASAAAHMGFEFRLGRDEPLADLCVAVDAAGPLCGDLAARRASAPAGAPAAVLGALAAGLRARAAPWARRARFVIAEYDCAPPGAPGACRRLPDVRAGGRPGRRPAGYRRASDRRLPRCH